MPKATVRANAQTLPEEVKSRIRKTKIACGLAVKRKDDDPVAHLSFVLSRDGKTLTLPKKNQFPRCFWHVKPSGDWCKDKLTGERLALEYLAFQQKNPIRPLLSWMVRDMPRNLDGVQVGFFGLIAIAADSGAARAREVSAYWDFRFLERGRLASEEARQ